MNKGFSAQVRNRATECTIEITHYTTIKRNGLARIHRFVCINVSNSDRECKSWEVLDIYQDVIMNLYSHFMALTKRQEAEMEVAELKMLRFSLGVTRMDKIRNHYIRGTAHVGKFRENTREARLRWYGQLRRKDDGYIGRRMLRMELPGKRKRGRPKRRFMDVVKEDMAEVEVTEEYTVDRNNWRRKIRCGDP